MYKDRTNVTVKMKLEESWLVLVLSLDNKLIYSKLSYKVPSELNAKKIMRN